MANNSAARRATTPTGILSFPHFFTPQSFKNKDGTMSKPTYGGVIVWTPDMKVDLASLKQVVQVAGIEKFGAEAFKKLLKSGKLRSPFRNSDEDENSRYPEGSVYINAKSTEQPGLVGRYKDPATGKAVRITDPEALYPGALVRFSVTAFGYDHMGNKGISFGINNVQKMGDGPRLDSRVKAEDEFDAEDAAETDLSDMETASVEGADADGDGEDLTALM